MALNLDGVDDNVNLGDIAAARFEELQKWSVLSFWRSENLTSFDRAIIAKFSGAGNRQFLLRADRVAPRNIQVIVRNIIVIEGGEELVANTWYLVAVVNDGTGNAGGLALYLLDMSGAFLDDNLTGTHGGDEADLTASIEVGVRSGADFFKGDLDYPCYIQTNITRDEILSYLHQPYRTAMRHKGSGVPFFLKLGHGAVNSVDLSGSGNSGTVTGGALGDSPPTGPLFGFDLGWQGAFTAALPPSPAGQAVPGHTSWGIGRRVVTIPY